MNPDVFFTSPRRILFMLQTIYEFHRLLMHIVSQTRGFTTPKQFRHIAAARFVKVVRDDNESTHLYTHGASELAPQRELSKLVGASVRWRRRRRWS